MAFGVGKAAQARRRTPRGRTPPPCRRRRQRSGGRPRLRRRRALAGRADRRRRPSSPGERVRVEAVDEESLRLVVGSGSSTRRELIAHRRPHRPRRGRRDRAVRRPVGRQGRARVRARRHLPARPAAAGAEGPGSLLPDPDHRPDGQGRPAHDHAERAAAGGDHEGQRPRPRQRGRLLPDRRAEERDRPGRELHGRDLADRADDPALRARPAHARRAALRARQDQRDPAGDHRRGHLAVGHQGLDRRGQGRRDPGEHAARDGPSGGGRARAACEGDRGRGRVPGLRAAARTRPT